jgi:2-dehydro-3-deoxyphosphogluconate aldolase/(4S)-4-hydroxy-2-oxoglutarate aldolase
MAPDSSKSLMNEISLISIVNEAPIAGADFVKVFPASAVGPRYFRELRGPFAQIPFMASGGVNLENAAEFIQFGADVLGLGGGLIPKSNDQFEQCAALAHQLLEVALKARESR